jgi:putative RNA 2'-phosphotransferase
MARLPRQLETLSRMLTYSLCHRPDELGLVLDEDGFVPIKRLLAALTAEPGWGHVRRHHLEQLAGLLQPSPVEISDDKIRGGIPGPAQMRRSLGEPPPALLYAAIPPKAHAAVAEHGLRPPAGQELILASTSETALKLGKRRSPDPVLITVQARAAADAGLVFQGYGDELFLTSMPLPRKFVQAPPLPKEPEKAKPKPKPKPAGPEIPLPPPGTLPIDFAEAMKKAGQAARKTGEPTWKKGARALRKKRGQDSRGGK